MRQLLDLALRLLGMANSQLAIHRRSKLKQHLAPGFHRLCEDHIPFNQWMFGGNIKVTIDDTLKINRMVDNANKTLGSGSKFQYGKKPCLERRDGQYQNHRRGFFRGGRKFFRRGRGKGERRLPRDNNNQPNSQSENNQRGRARRGQQTRY